MEKSSLRKLLVAIIVFAGFAAITPVQAARAPRPPATEQPPTPVSGL